MGKPKERSRKTFAETLGDFYGMIAKYRGSGFAHDDHIDGYGFTIKIRLNTDSGPLVYRFDVPLTLDSVWETYISGSKKTTLKKDKDAPRLAEKERARLVRVLFHFVANLFDMISEGLFEPNQVLFGFLEIPGAEATLYEAVGPAVETGNLKALGAGIDTVEAEIIEED